jgi:SOS regulatory protein LexA
VPSGGSSREQYWETSLSLARRAFEARNAKTAALALAQALGDALRMTEDCHRQFTRRGFQPLPDETFNDWQSFLIALYEGSRIYVQHATLVRSSTGSMLTELQAVLEAAMVAMVELQAMGTARPSKRTRELLLEKLGKLEDRLGAANDKLTGQHEGDDPAEFPVGTTAQESVDVPLIGRIAAGVPILAVESIEDVFPLPRRLVGHGRLFIVQVVGDSMIDARIADGDWVVVRQQSMAENGEIVAAMIDGEVTVKEFRWTSDGHRLLVPRNPRFGPIPGDDAAILGKVVTVLRRT